MESIEVLKMRVAKARRQLRAAEDALALAQGKAAKAKSDGVHNASEAILTRVRAGGKQTIASLSQAVYGSVTFDTRNRVRVHVCHLRKRGVLAPSDGSGRVSLPTPAGNNVNEKRPSYASLPRETAERAGEPSRIAPRFPPR